MANTVRYLAPGTRLVVRSGNLAPRWHTTSREVVIDVEPSTQVCPITNGRVHSFIHEGFRLYFPPAIVRTREEFAEGDLNEEAINNVRPVLFTYDIPDNAVYVDHNGKERPFYNPSDRLRRFAVRLNLSCWVLAEGDVPHALVARMLDAGCDPYVFKFDPEEAKKLVGMAVTKLRKEINAAITRADESRARAESQLTNAMQEEGMTEEEAERRFLERAEQINVRLNALTEDLNLVSRRFGINEHVLNINRLTDTGAALKVEMVKYAEAYAEAAKKLRAIGTDTGIALARAAEMDACPVEVMADYIREEGGETGNEDANKLLEAFRPDLMPFPATMEIPEKEDGTFSLAAAADAQYEDDEVK